MSDDDVLPGVCSKCMGPLSGYDLCYDCDADEPSPGSGADIRTAAYEYRPDCHCEACKSVRAKGQA